MTATVTKAVLHSHGQPLPQEVAQSHSGLQVFRSETSTGLPKQQELCKVHIFFTQELLNSSSI